MRFSGVQWAIATLTRWALGAGLLLSFTASASVDATQGFSVAQMRPLAARVALAVGHRSLMPQGLETDDPIIVLPGRFGLGPEFSADGSSPPRFEAKRSSEGEPSVNEDKRGDPLPPFVPASDGQTPGDLTSGPEPTATISRIEALMVPDGTEAYGPFLRLDASSVTPLAALPQSTTTPSSGQPSTMTVALVHPAIPLPTALADLKMGGASVIEKGRVVRPNYASLINEHQSEQEYRCLAEAVYFEARSEPEAGQAAVAQVVLNRVRSELYPKSICEVVYQNKERYLGCEFSFACEGKSLAVNEAGSWAVAVRIARQVLEGGIYNPDVGNATHYHADYVRPYWSKALERLDVIGRHIFYRLRPGIPGGVCPGCLLQARNTAG